MPVMAAKVPFALNLGPIVRSAFLLNWKPIQLGPKQHTRPRLSAIKHRNNTMPANVTKNVIGFMRSEHLMDASCGLGLFARHFGKTMELPSPLNERYHISVTQSHNFTHL